MTDQTDWHTTQKLHHELGRGDPFAAAMRATRMAMLITDPRQSDNPIVFANRAFTQLTGYTFDEVIGKNCRFLQGPDTSREAVTNIREAIAQARDINVDILNYRKDGSTFWNALYISPVVNEQDELQFFFASQLDVTDRMRTKLETDEAKAYFEQEVSRRTGELKMTLDRLQDVVEAKTMLLHEVDHRVKNNLQMISSLLTMQARALGDPAFRDVLYGILERIEALSTVHRRLYELDDVGRFNVSDFTRDLASDLVSATGRKDIQTRFDLDYLEVPAAKASPLALIINELLTNALKHAFRDGRGGAIDIALKHEDGNFLIAICDDGGGVACDLPTIMTSPHFGTRLVDVLSRQLRADVTRIALAPGLRVELRLPVEQPIRSTES